jgi:serine/threonine-protein kinase
MLATVNSDESEIAYYLPHFLPDGENILFTNGKAGTTQTDLLSLKTGERKVVLENARQARYLSTGHLVYEQPGTGNLMVVPFDLAALEVTGDSVTVVQQVRQSLLGQVDYAVSDNGTLVYVPGSVGTGAIYDLVWVDREGRESPVTQEKGQYTAPRLSPDGNKLVHSTGSGGTLRIYDFELDSFSRLTFEGTPSGSSEWSPDGEWITFQVSLPGQRHIVRQPADRRTPPEPLTQEKANAQMPTSWSPDGRFLVFNLSAGPGGGWDIFVLEMEQKGEPQPVVSTRANECCAVFSPDGKWLAYVSDESGFDQVYIRPYPGDVRFLVSGSEEAAGEPVWSPNGRELFYRSGRKMMAVSIEIQPEVRTGRPVFLFEGSYRGGASTPPGYQYYDVTPDGESFVMVKEPEQQEGQINVVLNWFEELKRLVPTN